MDVGELEHTSVNSPELQSILEARLLRLKTDYEGALQKLNSFSSDNSLILLYAEGEKLYVKWQLGQINEGLYIRLRKFRKRVRQELGILKQDRMFLMGYAYHIEGNVLSDMGQIYKSIEAHQKGLEIFLRLNHSYFINLIENNLGYTFYQIGAFSLARSYLNRVLEREQYPLDRARTLINLALVERALGLTNRAIKLFQKATQIQSVFNVLNEISYSYYELFRTYSKLNDLENMKKTMKSFQDNIGELNPLTRGRILICKALLMLHENKKQNLVKAISVFMEVFWKTPSFSIQFQAILYIVEEIIQNPSFFNDHKDLIEEISSIVNHLYLQGMKEKAPLKLILLNVIQASFKFLQKDMISTIAIINDCQKIVEKEGFPFLGPFLNHFEDIVKKIIIENSEIPDKFRNYMGSMAENFMEERFTIAEDKPMGFAIFKDDQVLGEIKFNSDPSFYLAKKELSKRKKSWSLDHETQALVRKVGSYGLLYVSKGNQFISQQKLDHIVALLTDRESYELNDKEILKLAKSILLVDI